MEITVKIKEEVANGAVLTKLFKEDFIVKPSEWKVHSFAYKAPRGSKTHVDLDVHVKNQEGLMKVVKVEFDYAVSNVQKVLKILADKEAFIVDDSLLTNSAIEVITTDSLKSKYPFVKIQKMEYIKPTEVSRVGTLKFDLDIDGIIYPYSQSIEFAKSEYKIVFDNLRPEMFEVTVSISPEGEFVVSDIMNKTGSDNIEVYDSLIMGLNDTRTLDVMLYISGNSKNKNLIVKSKPLASSQSFESLIDKIIKFQNNLPDSPRSLKPYEIIKNKPKWLHVDRITWINSDEITSNIGKYEVEFHIADEVFTKEIKVTFGYGNDYVFMNELNEHNIKIDEAYLFSPTEIISPEAALLVNISSLPQEGLNDLRIESIKFAGNKINRTNKIVEYNITLLIGGVKKIFKKNLAFKFSLNEAAIKEFHETTIFVTKIPSIISGNKNIMEASRQFIDSPNLETIDVFPKLKVKDIKEVETIPTILFLKIVSMEILRFDTRARGQVNVKIGFEIKGEGEIIYKTQPIPGRSTEEVVLESIGPSEITLIEPAILDGFRPRYFTKEQFKVPSGVELVNVELIHDEDDGTKLDVKFTIQINQNIKVIEKTYTFKKVEEVVVEETPEEAQDNSRYLETIDLSTMSVFVEIDKEPPYAITSSMFSGLPDDVRVSVAYKWPKVGSNEVNLDVSLVKGGIRKPLTIPIQFEQALSKATLKEYKAKRKAEKKGRVNG